MIKKNNVMKGLVFALITAVISGVSIFYSKISLSKIDPLVLTTSRNLFVGIVFFSGIFFSRKFNDLKKINRKDLFRLILIGLIGGGIPFYLFFTGLQSVGSQSANIIHKSLFIWVSLLAFIFLKEKLNLFSVIAYLFVIFGTFFIAPIKFVFGPGILMIATATLLWSIENIIAKKILVNISSEIVGMFRMGIGALVLIIMTLITGKINLLFHLNPVQLSSIFIGGGILSFYVYFWYKALKFAPANLVTLVLTFSVVIGNILSGSLTKIKITSNDLTTSVLICTGAMIILIHQTYINKNHRVKLVNE
ncbi:MAG: DMT family transporter [bacterium]|nr:DMT family transporter [bacterium]